MLSSIARSVRLQSHKFAPKATTSSVVRLSTGLNQHHHGSSTTTTTVKVTAQYSVKLPRYFSTAADPNTWKVEPPEAITADIAEGIQDTTLFYLRNGISNQRLVAVANDKESPLVMKWQRMMEIYLSTQVFVISGLGYSGDEKGLATYTLHLSEFINNECDDEAREMFGKVGKETWRELLATTFDLDLDNIQSVSIVDARNIMHKVSSKMQEPEILMKIHKECSKLPSNPEVEVEMAQKHQVLQNIIVNDVYMGGSPCIVEECGFGTGEKGYAHLQCVMSEYESDPLVAQYAGAAMMRIWEAAGLDISSIQQAGNIRLPGRT